MTLFERLIRAISVTPPFAKGKIPLTPPFSKGDIRGFSDHAKSPRTPIGWIGATRTSRHPRLDQVAPLCKGGKLAGGEGDGEGDHRGSAWLSRFAKWVAASTFVLLVAGGLVTSTDSGLSVPDWPLSYGQFFPPMVGGIRFEHTHRMIAAAVGLMMLALMVWLCFKENRKWVRGLGVAAFGMVLLQAILGGLTVLYFLPDWLSTIHATIGQTFFCMAVALALFTSRSWREEPVVAGDPRRGRTNAIVCAAATLLIYSQSIVGAWVRHSGSGVFWHVGAAAFILVLVALSLLVLSSFRPFNEGLMKNAVLMAGLTVVQIFLGMGSFVFTVMLPPSVRDAAVSSRSIEVFFTTAHQSVGALLLATSLVLTLGSFRTAIRSGWISKKGEGGKGKEKQLLAYFELTKPRLTLLAVVASGVGFYLGSSGFPDLGLLVRTLIGAALVGGGANALNQYLERDPDALMKRTKTRPLPSGRLKPDQALFFGVAISVIGILYLAWFAHLLASFIAVLTLTSYLFLYTPLKRRSSLCTLVGAVPGALPPLIGWAAARGELGWGAWILFSIVFLWQLPHFLAIAWLYRDDFKRAGFSMFTEHDEAGAGTARQAILYSLALLPVSLLPTVAGMTGAVYFLGALLLGAALLASGLRFAFREKDGRRFFRGSLVYLSLLFVLMFIDKGGV